MFWLIKLKKINPPDDDTKTKWFKIELLYITRVKSNDLTNFYSYKPVDENIVRTFIETNYAKTNEDKYDKKNVRKIWYSML